MKLRRITIAFLLVVCLVASVLVLTPSVARAESENKIYVETNSATKQGEYAYGYVYIDDLADIASFTVAVHYDASKVEIVYDYNAVACSLYDSSNANGCLQYSYIFDGSGSSTKTNLFYFYYKIKDNATVGNTFFDVVVSDAYNTSLADVQLQGKQTAFEIIEKQEEKTCNIYGTDFANTSVKGEFELNWYISDWQIASGAITIQYDADLFEFVELQKNDFFNNKITDVNTSLKGSIYLSFAGTEYSGSTNLLSAKFKTTKNVDETSQIKLTTTDLYDLALNKVLCKEFVSSVQIQKDSSYAEDKAGMILSSDYDDENGQVVVTIKLEKDSHLGAGDFVLTFNSNHLEYVSSTKEFTPSFFNINDKDVEEGKLKFSLISLSDITEEQTVLTVVFNAKHACQNITALIDISGSGLGDFLTNPIMLNFVGTSVQIPLRHSTVHHEAKSPTCTTIGWDAYDTCSRCDYSTKQEIPALGHSYGEGVVTEPTCSEQGYTTHSCIRCTHSYKDTYTQTVPHDYATEYLSDANSHWYKCKNCNATSTAQCHTLTDNVCSVCGYRAESPKDDEPSGDNTAVVAVAVVGGAVAVGGGTGLFIFLRRRRRKII